MILIIGEIHCTELDLRNCAKKCFGMEDEELELFCDYSKIKDFNFQSLRTNNRYSDVIIACCPHSCGKSGKYSNVIQKMENEPGYPNIIRAGGDRLKLTISSFKKAILQSKWYQNKNNLTK